MSNDRTQLFIQPDGPDTKPKYHPSVGVDALSESKPEGPFLIGDERLKMTALDIISLLAQVSIKNRFTGFFMTPKLRWWDVKVAVNLSPVLEFEITGQDLEALMVDALRRVTNYYRENGYEKHLND